MSSTGLMKYEVARQALAEASRIDECLLVENRTPKRFSKSRN
jgi:hypothetical protein